MKSLWSFWLQTGRSQKWNEYLWEEYIHKPGADLSARFQMLIVKYLKSHSDNHDLRG
ncbi:MAG TPA: hypothetical protein VMV70_07290 [Gallionella sp.]|nr:hypothetical protein [Gallionella sp.]